MRPSKRMGTGAIVLCGGRSSRMGQPKAWLPFGGEFMLARVVRIVREVVGPVVVVAAPGQEVPPLPAGVPVVCDEREGCGPLAGLAAGLAALEGQVDAVYLSSCDVPLLKAEFVRRVVSLLQDPTPRPPEDPPPQPPSLQGGGSLPSGVAKPSFNSKIVSFSPSLQGGGWGGGPLIAFPRVDGRLHPLAAAYQVSVLPHVREMLAANRLRLMDLFDAVSTRVIEAEELAGIDPRLLSLRNVNTPGEYEAALRELGASQSG